MKKLLTGLCVLALGAGVVAGCSDSGTDRVGERPIDRTPSASPPTDTSPPARRPSDLPAPVTPAPTPTPTPPSTK